MSVVELLLAIDILEGLMISDKDELLLHQVVTQVLQILYNDVEFQNIGGIALR
jgi:hypothetical protein